MAYVSVPKDLTKVKNKVAFNLTKRQLICIGKDGMHLEDVLMHMIRVKFLRPPVRKYETENYYETDPEQIRQSPDAGKPKGGKTVAKKEK